MRTRILVMLLASLVSGRACSCPSLQESGKAVEPLPVTDEERKSAESINRFGFRMLGELTKEDGKNIFFSPASVSLALAMTWNGTRGDTAAELAKALEIAGIEKDVANKGYRTLTASARQGDPKVEVNIANALWVGEGRAFHPDFLRIVQESYFADASTLNFADKEAAADRINGWVKEKTKERIDRILSPMDVSGVTDTVLTNAIYFKGIWSTQFDPKLTSTGNFTLADGTTKPLPFMRGTRVPGKFWSNKQFEAAALPYGAGRYNLYLFVPARDSGLKQFLSTVSPEKWQEWTAALQPDKKNVNLPRFKVEMEKSLVTPLKDMGVKLAFGGGDFAPMGFPGAWISEVKHKAVMEVNEEGTTAAAATAVVVTRSIQEPFTVDRPFFAVIADSRSGAVLFMGAIWDPASL